ESHGFEHDNDRPYAYHFRDFVIAAFNQDMPYDQFVRWQLAGDEFEPENLLALKATGFLGAGVFPTQITANEVERTRYDALDELPGRLAQWEQSHAAATLRQSPWVVLDLVNVKSSGDATLTRQDDGSFLASGTNPETDSFTFSARTDTKDIAALRIEALSDPS